MGMGEGRWAPVRHPYAHRPISHRPIGPPDASAADDGLVRATCPERAQRAEGHALPSPTPGRARLPPSPVRTSEGFGGPAVALARATQAKAWPVEPLLLARGDLSGTAPKGPPLASEVSREAWTPNLENVVFARTFLACAFVSRCHGLSCSTQQGDVLQRRDRRDRRDGALRDRNEVHESYYREQPPKAPKTPKRTGARSSEGPAGALVRLASLAHHGLPRGAVAPLRSVPYGGPRVLRPRVRCTAPRSPGLVCRDSRPKEKMDADRDTGTSSVSILLLSSE